MGEPSAISHVGAERRIVCGRCQTAFECRPAGGCWCAAESFRLPLPVDDTECLCPACLRAAAGR
jgi:hypothetical protein